MPSSPPGTSEPRPVVLMQSPREAAAAARVYRRRRRDRPRERWLRIVALAGALFVHLAVLVGVVLGPAYVPPDLPDHPGEALKVRFIEIQDEPPPPPPVRGTPPKKHGPVHRGSMAASGRVARASARPLPHTPALAPIPVPTLQPPVIDTTMHPAMPVPQKVVAAPVPPVTLPTPSPTPDLAPVPVAGEPPLVTLDTPPVSKPVPPKFQPEVPRKPQAEGNRPIPPPPSLAMPDVPPQAAPEVAPPTLAMDARLPVTDAPASVVVARPEQQVAAPPVPALQPVPLAAEAAPSVDLQPQITRPTPVTPAVRPQVQAVTVQQADEPQLEAVPLAPIAPSMIEKPSQAAVDVPKLDTPAPHVQVDVARPVPSPASAADETAKADAATAEKAAVEASEQTASSTSPTSATAAEADVEPTGDRASSGRENDVSSAPDANPQGSDTAAPGSPQGVDRAPLLVGKDGSVVLPAAGQGRTGEIAGGEPGGNGADKGADKGDQGARLGSYIQLKPHGDTDIMRHRAPNVGYKATRFEQDWAPENETALDTALRHAVEKTTVRHTFHLPRGVRVECVGMPLFPMVLLGCHNPDPPAKTLDAAIYERLNLPGAPLVPPAPATSTAPPAPTVQLTNAVQCTNARLSGGPLPPGCETTQVKPPVVPPSGSGSWVPASDQF